MSDYRSIEEAIYAKPLGGYQPEYISIRKDFIYNAISAIESAIGYMPQIKSDVPQWQKQADMDHRRMRDTLDELKEAMRTRSTIDPAQPTT